MGSLHRRTWVLLGAFVAIVCIRSTEAALLPGIIDQHRAAIGGPGVEGNSRVVNGFFIGLLWVEFAAAILHVAVSAIGAATLLSVVRTGDPDRGRQRLAAVLRSYFWSGAVVGFLAMIFGFGFGLIPVVIPMTFDVWGLAVPLVTIVLPVAVAVANRERAPTEIAPSELVGEPV